jgi:hypothetical protein
MESNSPKRAKEAECHGSHLRWKETQCVSWLAPGTRFPDRNTRGRDHGLPREWRRYDLAGVAPGPHDQRRPGVPSLRDREERRGFRIFTERELYFPSAMMPTIWIDSHRAVLKIACRRLARSGTAVGRTPDSPWRQPRASSAVSLRAYIASLPAMVFPRRPGIPGRRL